MLTQSLTERRLICCYSGARFSTYFFPSFPITALCHFFSLSFARCVHFPEVNTYTLYVSLVGGDALVYIHVNCDCKSCYSFRKAFRITSRTHTHTHAARARSFWHRRHNTFALTQATLAYCVADLDVDDNRRRNNAIRQIFISPEIGKLISFF